MKTNNKFLLFLKKNAFYFVLGFCILAVALSVTLLLVLDTDKGNNVVEKPPIVDPVPDNPDDHKKPDEPVNPDPPVKPTVTEIVFAMPVEGSVIKEYNEVSVFSPTLQRFTVHYAMDFAAPAGTPVCAAYAGTVESITTNYLKGVTVTVDHGDGLKSVYNSLEDGEQVTVGQKVEKGDIIGTVGSSNLQELTEGAHLHFEVTEKGEYVNPLKYLVAEEK